MVYNKTDTNGKTWTKLNEQAILQSSCTTVKQRGNIFVLTCSYLTGGNPNEYLLGVMKATDAGGVDILATWTMTDFNGTQLAKSGKT